MIVLGIFCIFLMFVIIWLWVAYKKACEHSNGLIMKYSRENKEIYALNFENKNLKLILDESTKLLEELRVGTNNTAQDIGNFLDDLKVLP